MSDLKPFKTYSEQVELLKNKGFIITDEKACKEFLNVVNYYRLAAYYLPFRKPDGTYFSNISFERIRDIYYFDQKLRSLVFSTIESIETYLRDQIAYYFSEKYGPEGYMDASNFRIKHDHADFADRINSCIKENKTSLIVKHHDSVYNGRYPLWVIIEFFTIGFLSHFYLDMKTQDKKQIANHLYGVSASVLEGWLRCVTDLRNKCAHYSRIYYWIFPALPSFPDINNRPVFPQSFRPINQRKLFVQLYMLKQMYPLQDKWNERFLVSLKNLLDEYKDSISLIHIGFPADWETQLSI